jgi:hypothetical protein
MSFIFLASHKKKKPQAAIEKCLGISGDVAVQRLYREELMPLKLSF